MRSGSLNRYRSMVGVCCVLAAAFTMGTTLWHGNAGSQSDEGRPKLLAQVGHSDIIKSIAVSSIAGSQVVLTASLDKSALLWNFSPGKQIKGLYGHGHSILSAAFSQDGRLVVMGDIDYK